MGSALHATGGDPVLANDINVTPGEDDTLLPKVQAWEKTENTFPQITDLQTVPIWTVVSSFKNATVAELAGGLENSYNYLAENPEKHVTKCRLTINSDWGALSLLTPSAYLRTDSQSEGVYSSSVKIGWGGGQYIGQQSIELVFSALFLLQTRDLCPHAFLRN